MNLILTYAGAIRTLATSIGVGAIAAAGAYIYLDGNDALAFADSVLGGDMVTSVALAASGLALGVQVAAQRRKHTRFRCRVPAEVLTGRGPVKLRVENLSRGGAQVFCRDGRVAQGEFLPLRIGAFTTRAEVRWTQGARAGFAFHSELNEAAFEDLMNAVRNRLSTPRAEAGREAAPAAVIQSGRMPTREVRTEA